MLNLSFMCLYCDTSLLWKEKQKACCKRKHARRQHHKKNNGFAGAPFSSVCDFKLYLHLDKLTSFNLFINHFIAVREKYIL